MRWFAILSLSLFACAAPLQQQPAAVEPEGSWADALAWTWLYEEVDPERSRELQEDIKALDPEASAELTDALVRTSGMSPSEAAVFRRAVYVAGDRSFLGLTHEEGEQVLEWASEKGLFTEEDPESGAPGDEPLGACFPKFTCPYTTTWPKSVAFTLPCATTTTPCTLGSGYDRTGNSRCEAGRCDYRLKFGVTNATLIGGRTGTADCVLSRHGTMSAASYGTEFHVLIGGGTSLLCGSVFPFASHFQVR